MINASNGSLTIITPSCTTETHQGEFLLESEMYYQDLLSVWSGSIKVSADGHSEIVNENHGTLCYYGKKPLHPKGLPEPPVVDTVVQKNYFNYDEKIPFKFFFKKFSAKVHITLGKDPELDDVIYETITESESVL
ncbi:MAG: hypothetical protein N3A65_05120 [candidate division WOR-3 bacterium]|nr:hypothetical protein [candidate division WOR-3 bacterium]